MASKTGKLTTEQRARVTQLDFALIDLRGTDDRWSRPENVWSATGRSARSELSADAAGLYDIASGVVSFWVTPSLYGAL